MNDVAEVKAARAREVREWLETIINGLNISATKLARASGLDKGTITRYLRDSEYNLSDTTLHQIKLGALDLATASLVNGSSNQMLVDVIQVGPGGDRQRAELITLIQDVRNKDLGTIKAVAVALAAPHLKK